MKTPWTAGMVIRLVIAIPFIIVFCFAEAFAEMFLGGRGKAVERWTLDPLQRIICWDRPFFSDASLLLNTSFIANVDGMRRHKWNYGSGADRYTAKYRVCEHCPMHQRTFGVGAGRHWDWRLDREESWNTGRAPECPPPTEPQIEWSRVEDKHPRWEIKNPDNDGKNYLCTDAVIRTYGRKHTERLLHDLPPLPDKAWEVLDG